MADNNFEKDPEAVLDYVFDWKKYLEDDETIVSHEITTPEELTLNRSEVNGGLVTVWLSGGLGGKTYRVECKVTTSKGRIDERSIWVEVKER